MNRLSKYFVRGLMVLFPMVITYFVVATAFRIIEGAVDTYIPVKFPGMGIIIMVGALIIAGWISVNCSWGTEFVLTLIDKFVEKIPVVKFVYSSVKRVAAMLFESKTMFSQVVMIPYPSKGMYSIGFLMPEPSEKIAKALGEDNKYESVFLPWSLNMTSGFNVFVLKEDIKYLDISVEDAFQYILTAGGVMPGIQVDEEVVSELPTGVETESLQKAASDNYKAPDSSKNEIKNLEEVMEAAERLHLEDELDMTAEEILQQSARCKASEKCEDRAEGTIDDSKLGSELETIIEVTEKLVEEVSKHKEESSGKADKTLSKES